MAANDLLQQLAGKMASGQPYTMQDASRRAQEVGRCFWLKRELPGPCKELAATMDGPCDNPKVECKVIQPNAMSAYVAFIWIDGKTFAVAKQRGKTPEKAAREECHYAIAQFLGAGEVTAPCIGMELDLTSKCKVKIGTEVIDDQNVWALLARKMEEAFMAIQGFAPPSIWVTVEKCVPIAPPGQTCGIGARLANKYGCCDIQQAYAATPDGQASGEKVALRDHAPSDAEFFQMVESLNVAGVHRLCVLAMVVLQRDGSPPNLMIKEHADGSYGLVAIDPTTCLGTVSPDKLTHTIEDDDTSPTAYWYPMIIGLPQANQPFDEGVKKHLLSLKATDLSSCIINALSCAPGADFVGCQADAEHAVGRLQKLQELVQSDGNLSVREYCFRIVGSWKRDWDIARKDNSLQAMPQIEEHKRNGGNAESWGRRCLQKRIQQKINFAIVGIAAAATAAAIIRARKTA